MLVGFGDDRSRAVMAPTVRAPKVKSILEELSGDTPDSLDRVKDLELEGIIVEVYGRAGDEWARELWEGK